MPGLSLVLSLFAQTLFSALFVSFQLLSLKAPGTVFQREKTRKDEKKETFPTLRLFDR